MTVYHKQRMRIGSENTLLMKVLAEGNIEWPRLNVENDSILGAVAGKREASYLRETKGGEKSPIVILSGKSAFKFVVGTKKKWLRNKEED